MDSEFFKQSYIQPYNEGIGLCLHSCGVERCRGGHTWGPSVRDYFLIHYIVKGKGIFSENGKSYELSQGDGFLIEPKKTVSYTADKNDPWQYKWVGFDGSDSRRFIGYTSLSAENPIFHYEKDNLLSDLLRNILDAKGQTPCDEMKMSGRLLLFLSELAGLYGKNESSPVGGHAYVEKAISFIQSNYQDSITVEDIAASAGLSRSHMYRLFMEHADMGPNEYLAKYRISIASALLRSNRYKVNEISDMCGFSDQLYFSRVFKKLKGIPPGKYSKNTSGGDNS